MPSVQYIVDEKGNRTAAVLPLPEYGELLEELLEDAELGRLAREAMDDECIPLEQYIAKMNATGRLEE